MITSLLLDKEPDALQLLENKIYSHCPNLIVSGRSHCMKSAQQLITDKEPDLVFLDIDTAGLPEFNWSVFDGITPPEFVFLTKGTNSTLDVMKRFEIQYLKKPIEDNELVDVVTKAEYCVQSKKEKSNSDTPSFKPSVHVNNLIGVPTMEGYEFIPAHKIIRCEGLQKCTRIVTQDRSDIVSSYHIGVFKNLLQPFGFFLPHKSFLINLSLIKKFHKEGTITMVDDGYVPLARRKRSEFLSLIRRI